MQTVHDKVLQRGWIEMTPTVYANHAKYMKTMPQFGVDVEHYTGYPVLVKDATDNVIVRPDGTRLPLLIRKRKPKGQTHEQSSLF